MKRNILLGLLCLSALGWTGCSDDDDNATLQNDWIKKSQAPLVVGDQVRFSYAAGTTTSKLATFKATASAPGAEGTNFEPYTWRTENGQEISTIVASDCQTTGCVSTANIIDAQATTLRYFYVVPAELKGKKVSFEFSTTAKDGSTVVSKTPTYTVSAMDMRKNIQLCSEEGGACCFSVEDMQAYTMDEVISNNLMEKIDFIYAYAPTKTVGENQYNYKHAIFAPGASMYYPDDFELPGEWPAKATLMDKKLYVWDGQLKNDDHVAIYVDDIDLKSASFDNSGNGLLDLRSEGGVFLKTADGRHTAYIYINSLDNNAKTMTFGIKKLSK